MELFKVVAFVVLVCVIQVIANAVDRQQGFKDDDLDSGINSFVADREIASNIYDNSEDQPRPLYVPINYIYRARRQIAPINPDKPFTINGVATHGQGVTAVNGAGSVRLWESDNKRHQLHGMGSYGQVFTPYGNSRPNIGVGGGYVFRF